MHRWGNEHRCRARHATGLRSAMRSSVLLLMVSLSLTPVATASAAPDHSATLDQASPSFSWEGTGSGVSDPTSEVGQPVLRCTGEVPFRCRYVLLRVEAAGDLAITLDSEDGAEVSDPTRTCALILVEPCVTTGDVDGHLYSSTAAGEPMGANLARECVTTRVSESCRVPVQPGWYVLEVQFFNSVDARYAGKVELTVDPQAPPAPSEPQVLTADGCRFTLYYFRDSAERLRPRVPQGFHLRAYPGGQGVAPGSATIAAAAYRCDRIEVPGAAPAPATFTVLSVVVTPVEGTSEGPATSDFYVQWIHSDHPRLAALLAERGLPAQHVPGMRFDRLALSLAVRTSVPWAASPYELRTNGYHEDMFHPHRNTFLHAKDGRVAVMDFLTQKARDRFCFQLSDERDAGCGGFTGRAGTPVAEFFGAASRTPQNAWDHDPIGRSWFILR